MTVVFDETGKSLIYESSRFTGTEIPLSNWKRSFCQSIEYPEFGHPEPVTLPDILEDQGLNPSGFVCYETTFVLDDPKALLLEISSAVGNVDVFINGETAGIQIVLPYRYDLAQFTRQGKNYLAIEVAVVLERNDMSNEANQLEEMLHDKYPTGKPCIIGAVRLYTNGD